MIPASRRDDERPPMSGQGSRSASERKWFNHHAARVRQVLRGIAIAALLTVLPLCGVVRAQDVDRPSGLLIKYRSEGPYALTECAGRLSARGDRFAAHLADRSEALDALQARYGRLRHRPVFRSAPSGSFAAEAGALRKRLRAARSRRGGGAQGRKRGDHALPELAHVYRAPVPRGTEAQDLLDALRALPHVEYAHPDYAIAIDQAVPPFDDPFLASEGSWGQPYADLWGLERIGAPEVWAGGIGKGVVVAVVDTGIDTEHPDLRANVWVNAGEDLDGDGVAEASDRNGFDDDGNGFVDDLVGFDFGDSVDANDDGDYDDPGDVSDADPFDEFGHGTHVAGTIAAVANNGEGIVGVAPGVQVMAVKGFSAEGLGRDSVLWRAVLYAAENGADVINNSWSCGRPCPSNGLATDVLAHVEALGAVVVTSAGNAATDVSSRSPENTDQVVTVGSLGSDDLLSSFSNRGWGIDVVAPGGGPSTTPGVLVSRRNILSLLTSAPLENEEAFVVGDRYRRLSGTSMASPHVAGAVALARARRPDLEPAALREWLRLGARDVSATGHDWLYGAGVLHLPTLFADAPPELAIDIDAPASGSIVDPEGGAVRLELVAHGTDVDSVDLAIAEGRSGRVFVPLDALPAFARVAVSRPADAGIAYAWDPAGVEPGARVLRVRVVLRDGREVVRFRVFGLERVHPTDHTLGERDLRGPATDGRRVAWPMEIESDGGGTRGVAVDRLRAPSLTEPTPFDVGGFVTVVDVDGRLLAWRVGDASAFSIGGCVLQPARSKKKSSKQQGARRASERDARGRGLECVPFSVDRPGEVVSRPWVADGWLVWQAGTGPGSIEGCRPTRQDPRCKAFELVAFGEADPPWRLQSFDGRTLLLQAGARVARCAPRADGQPCALEEIAFAPGTPMPDTPLHDGELLLFGDVGIAVLPPDGCLLGEILPECVPQLTLTTRLHACELAPGAAEAQPTCTPTVLTEPLRFDSVVGRSVSGRRLAWSAADAFEAPSIRLCEFDAESGACPVQRVTGALSEQVDPDLGRRSLVWRGARDAGESIWSLALPELRGPSRTRKVRPGPFRVPLRAWAGAGGDLHFRVEVLAADPRLGLAPELEIVDRGRPGGRIWLRGRTGKSAEGSARVRIIASDASGLESRWDVDLEAAPRKRPWAHAPHFEIKESDLY